MKYRINLIRFIAGRLALILLFSCLAPGSRLSLAADFAVLHLTEKSPSPKVISRALTVEIGDSTKSDFVPVYVLSAWGGQCYLRVNLATQDDVEFDKPAEIMVGGKTGLAVRQSDAIRHQMFQRADGNFEWEIILDTMPLLSEFKFRILSKGLLFFYQPELTVEEIEGGYDRPDSVVDSYAVYRAGGSNSRITIRNTDSACENYETGKVFHIYRPRAHDSEGRTVWCTIKIDSLFTIIVPEEFLKQAVYPITIDPTFGNTNVGGSTGYISSSSCQALSGSAVYRYTAASGDTITSFSMYCLTYTSPAYISYAVYSCSGDYPAGRLASGKQDTITNGSMQWNTTEAVSQAMTSGATYVMAYGDVSPASAIRTRFDTESNVCSVHGSTSLPDIWSHSSYVSNRWSMYVTYKTGTAVNYVSPRRRIIESVNP
jgi:hypothetical protein